MAIHEITASGIAPLAPTTFRDHGLRERQDLQRVLRTRFDAVDPDVMILAEEFGGWDESKRRIDLLGIDRDARLVVIELKRTEDGGHMELQALRYAAMVSRMTFEQAVAAHTAFLGADADRDDAEKAILEFLDWEEPDEERFGQDVRIVLVSADFSKELTTSVLWLIERDLDVRCVRIRPYELEGRVLVDVQQVLPLPEASEYVVKVREKERRERQARTSGRDYTRFDVAVGGRTYERQAKRNAVHLVIQALAAKGATPQEISEVVFWKGKRLWRSAEGTLDAEEFDTRMREEEAAGGAKWDPSRWHCGEGDLVHNGDRTWALTNQWGGKTREAMQDLLARWPASGVRVAESRSASAA